MYYKRTMKKQILISTLVLLILVSCDNSGNKEKPEQQQEIPTALQDKGSSGIISKRGYENLLESLYKELATNTPELNELEIKIKSLSESKDDSTKLFDRYNGKNQYYYSSADSHVKQIKDSILRKRIKLLISASLTRYNSKIYRHSEILKSIDKKTMTLDDLHEVLMITTTLPIIENYQNDNLPATKSIDGNSKQLDKVLNIEDALLQKYEKKEKME